MRKLSFLVLCFFTVSLSFAQQKTTPNPYKDLTPINLVISRANISHVLSLLGGAKTIEAKRSSELIDNFIEIYSEDNKTEANLLKKYKSQITGYIEGISSFGESRGALNYADVDRFTNSFATYNNKLVFVQTGVYSDYAYNTLKLNANERALKVANDIALPSMYNFKPLLDITEIQYYMIVVGYTVQDFGSDSIADKDAETVALLVSKVTLSKYINAEITDEQLLKLSILYNMNKSTGSNLKKISTI